MSSNETAGGRFFWGGMLIVFGILMLLDRLDIVSFGEVIRNYWPLILVAIGAKLILFPKARQEATITFEPGAEPATVNFIDNAAVSDYINENRFIGDIHFKIQSNDFKGGSASTFIGDQKFDLSGIAITGGERAFVVSGFIGDATIILPKSIPYAIQVNAGVGDFVIFGRKEGGVGINKYYKSPDYDSATSRLYVRISFMIGDVTIL